MCMPFANGHYTFSIFFFTYLDILWWWEFAIFCWIVVANVNTLVLSLISRNKHSVFTFKYHASYDFLFVCLLLICGCSLLTWEHFVLFWFSEIFFCLSSLIEITTEIPRILPELSTSHQSGIFVTIDEATLTHHNHKSP